MARYTGPSSRISRRFGQPIFGPCKALEKRNFPPGVHGPRSRRKNSDYALGLMEKQKLRYMYGLLERQFRRVFAIAKRERGVTGERFMQLLETRLDSVVYLLGFGRTRRAARQFVGHGHIRVNGRKVDIPSYQVKAGDQVQVRDNPSSRQLATRCLEETRSRNVPPWLNREDDALRGTVARLPTREEMEPMINDQLIVEFYSRF
jgi:small subunit ribosomal protein S4